MNIDRRLRAALIAAISVVAIFSAFNQWRNSQGWNGFPDEFASLDDRLLGHFPYPEASADDLILVGSNLKIHKDTYKAFEAMKSAAAVDGVELILLSGFRSIELQRQIFYGKKSARNQIAIEKARVSAPPGYSEHSTGYAIDLGDRNRRETDFESDFESTDAFSWLQKNADKYGFVLSFPKGNTQQVSYAPWQWRFEGTEQSKRLFRPANTLTGRD